MNSRLGLVVLSLMLSALPRVAQGQPLPANIRSGYFGVFVDMSQPGATTPDLFTVPAGTPSS